MQQPEIDILRSMASPDKQVIIITDINFTVYGLQLPQYLTSIFSFFIVNLLIGSGNGLNLKTGSICIPLIFN